MKKRQCVILIDGSNFYFKLKDLQFHSLLNFDFSGFAKMLAGNKEIIQAAYYVGAIRTDGTKKAQKLFNEQRKLLDHLKKHNFTYQLGYILKTDGAYHEKGVDVHIAVSILVTAYENLADHVILVSSDTDLLPAVNKAREKGSIVEYVGFAHRPSIAMKTGCSKYRLLKKEEIVSFITETA